MDSCYMPNFSKHACKSDNDCDDTYPQCCTERDNSVKARPTFGMCVKENTCDYKRGICSSGQVYAPRTKKEYYTTQTVEGYEGDSDCSNWKGAFWYLFVIIVLMMFCIVSLIKPY